MALPQFDPTKAIQPGRYRLDAIFNGLSTDANAYQVEKWDWYDSVSFPTDNAGNLKGQQLTFFAVAQGQSYTPVLNTNTYQKDVSDTNLQTQNLATYGFVCTGIGTELYTNQFALGTAAAANFITDWVVLHSALIRNIQCRLLIDNFPYDSFIMQDAPAAGGPSGAVSTTSNSATVRVDTGFVSNGIPSVLNQRTYVPLSAYDMSQPVWIPPAQLFNVVATFGQQATAANMSSYKPVSTTTPVVFMRVWLRGWRVRLSQA